jgi:hypothetical protein
MKIIGPYFLNTQPFRQINPVERKIFLQLVNAINDQGFDEWISRGASGIFVFEDDIMGYSISFDGKFKLKLIFNITDERFYFKYEDVGYEFRVIDVFLLKTWKDIDDWIQGKQFYPENVKDISQDLIFRGLKKVEE